ncbi:MAG: helix-turn-helix transcriptional regulator [Oscillospiraceae bacterium]|nr:helix-turn-helix transcriptional regulator [Oscillospiraceae bacterium]
MDYMEWFAARLAQLRMEKGVSARDMSLSLGQSESYINKIENHRTMPSMAGFFYICEYLGIEPADFFRTESNSPQKAQEVIGELEKLSPKQAEHILAVIKDLNMK